MHNRDEILRGTYIFQQFSRDKVAEDLEAAAHSDPEGWFDVTAADIEPKFDYEFTAFLQRNGKILAFIAARDETRCRNTGLTFRYIEGVIIDKSLQGKGLVKDLLDAAIESAPLPDVLVLHTQTPAIVVGMTKWFLRVWPVQPRGRDVHRLLRDDIKEELDQIGRQIGDPKTGIWCDAYPKKLWHGQIIGADPRLDLLRKCGDTDAMLLVCFCSDQAGGLLLAGGS